MRYKIAKTGIGAGIGLIIIGGMAMIFHLWFDFFLPLGFAVIPASLLISMMMVPTITIAHCLMCKAGEHRSCLSPRYGGSLCCCTIEVLR